MLSKETYKFRYNAIKYNAIMYNEIKYNAIKYNPIKYKCFGVFVQVKASSRACISHKELKQVNEKSGAMNSQ